MHLRLAIQIDFVSDQSQSCIAIKRSASRHWQRSWVTKWKHALRYLSDGVEVITVPNIPLAERDIVMAFLSVCLSVGPSVWPMPVLCLNDRKYRRIFDSMVGTSLHRALAKLRRSVL